MAIKPAAGKRSKANIAKAAPAKIEFAALGELRVKADSIEEARKALDHGAALGRGLWISFVSLGAYLFVAVGSVTHRDLFLETPLRLPLIGVELPLVAFFWVTPLLFLILHANLLLNLKLIADNVVLWRDLTDAALKDEADEHKRAVLRDRLRLQLPNFLLVQALAAPDMNRRGAVGAMIRLMLVATAAIGPAILLFLFQTQFLPYHREWVTWLHRLVLIADVGMVWYFWLTVFGPARRLRFVRGFGYAASALLLFVSFVLATFPNERIRDNRIATWLDRSLPLLGIGCPEGQPRWRFPTRNADVPKEGAFVEEVNCHYTVTQILFDAGANEITGRSISLFSNRLILPDADFVTMKESDLKEAEVSISLRGRRLEKAVLVRADLRKADFTGAVLTGARLDEAELQGAKFKCGIAKTERETKDGEAKSSGTSSQCADLQGASLNFASLQGANFRGASLQGASLFAASLRGAILAVAFLQGASLESALLQGASLAGALLQGADIDFASLQGASLDFASLQGASLAGASLQGASLESASLQGTQLTIASLKGASLSNTCLDGASLDGANFEAAELSRVSLFAVTGKPELETARSRDFRFDLNNETSRACLKIQEPVTADLVAKKIQEWLAAIPEGEARENAREQLNALRNPPDTVARQHWEIAARKTPNPVESSQVQAEVFTEIACKDYGAVAKSGAAATIVDRVARTHPIGDYNYYGPLLPADRLSLFENLNAAGDACPGANYLDAEIKADLAREIATLKAEIAKAIEPDPKN